MPRNNSAVRKSQRKADALLRDTMRTLRACGHYHTDNGAQHCDQRR